MEYQTIIIILLAIAIAAFFWFFQKRQPTTFADMAGMVLEAERVARVFVAGAQQMYESNQTSGVDQRYEEVEIALLDVFPSLTPTQAKKIIEAAVIGFKTAREQGWLPEYTQGKNPVTISQVTED